MLAFIGYCSRKGVWLILLTMVIPLMADASITVKKENGRYKGLLHLTGNTLSADQTGLINSISLHFEWWTLFGEPVEIYHIQWEASSHFDYEGVSYYKTQLAKYPDLLERFNNLKPTDIVIRLNGSASGEKMDRGMMRKDPAYYSQVIPETDRRKYSHIFSGGFTYDVIGAKVMTAKAGRLGKGLVPGSPSWFDFFVWGGHFGEGQQGDPSDEALTEVLKKMFVNSTEIKLFGSLVLIEWPEKELETIATLYKQYESGEKEPSPKEAVEEGMEDIRKMQTYQGDDEWAAPIVNVVPEVFTSTATGKMGYINDHNKVIIDPVYDEALPFVNNKAIVKKGDYYGLIDKQGRYIISPQFKSVEQRYEGYLVVQNNEKLFGICDEQGNMKVPFKFSFLAPFENGRAKARLFLRSETVDFEYCSSRTLHYYDEGEIDLTGAWVGSTTPVLYVIDPTWPDLRLKAVSTVKRTSEEREEAERRKREKEERTDKCVEQRNRIVSQREQAIKSKGGRIEYFDFTYYIED